MSYEAALSVLAQHLATAGASLTPKVHRVRRGPPVSPPAAALFAYWYEGDQESTTGGNTLAKTNHEERITVAGMWPVKTDTDALSAEIDRQLAAAIAAIRALLWADASFGGNLIGLDIGQAQVGFVDFGGNVVRGFEMPLELDFAWTGDIAL